MNLLYLSLAPSMGLGDPSGYATHMREVVERDLRDFPAFLARADCLVSPVVRTESTVAPPLTWIEAMALGTPVATTSALGVDEAVIDGETGVVASTTASLAEPLLALLAERSRLAALGENAARLALGRFSLETIADGYFGFFGAAAARRRAERKASR